MFGENDAIYYEAAQQPESNYRICKQPAYKSTDTITI